MEKEKTVIETNKLQIFVIGNRCENFYRFLGAYRILENCEISFYQSERYIPFLYR